MRNILLFLMLMLSLPVSLWAQKGVTVSGRVTDAATGLPVEGATVFIVETQQGSASGSDGRYSFVARAGEGTLRVAHVSYRGHEQRVTLDGGAKINIALNSDIRIEDIVVSSKAEDSNITRVQTGVQTLEIAQIRRMPALLGEVDVLKAIQMMPGVQMTSEGGSGFSVRGGSPDQNLILLDDAVIYNPSHLMGFFSIFNNDFVSSAEIYKGDMPLRYGGRLASLLEVNTIDRQPERFRGTGGIGLISSRLMLEGPLGKKSSWHLGGRRSYADAFLPLAGDPNVKKATIHFFDLNAKFTHRFSKRDMLQASGYWGGDAFGMVNMGRVSYGNGAASVAWRRFWNEKLTSRLSFNFSDFTLKARSNIVGISAAMSSNIRDYQLRLDFEHNVGPLMNLSYGASTMLHQLRPGRLDAEGLELVPMIGENALEHTVYVQNQHQVGRAVTVRYGARMSMFQNMGESIVYNYDEDYKALDSVRYAPGEIYHTHLSVEPRVGMLIRTGANSSVKASYAYNTQFMQLANNSASGSPLDVWFSAGPNIRPQRSHLASVGYFRNMNDNMYALSAEVYYKNMRRVIDFKDGADLMLNSQLDGEIRAGNGQSYGLELAVAKTRGALTGFVNYTISRSDRKIPGINGGRRYRAPFDKTHMFNIAASYTISPAWEVAVSWIYATGNPTTYPLSKFTVDGLEVIYYSDRNAYRMPDYHRMDVSVTWHPPHRSARRWRGEWNLSVYNAYNKKNPWMIRFQQYENGSNYAEMTYLFGVVPSITYNFKF